MNALPPAIAFLLLLSVAVQANHAGDIPCSDPRGCPDLLVDGIQLALGAQTLEPFTAADCAVQEGSTEPGLRQLLRFTYTSPNLGLGDLIVGGPASDPDLFEWSGCHRHYHFKEYADYRLWTPEAYAAWDALRSADPGSNAEDTLAAHPELLDGLVKGEKRGFCVIDVAPALPNARHAPVVPDPVSKYNDCSTGQGISLGWADTYNLDLDGQWIDVTEVAPGAYVLEAEVNAEHLYEELDYSNNRAALPAVVSPGPYNTVLGPVLDPFVQAALGLVPTASVAASATVQAQGEAVHAEAAVSTVDGVEALVETPVVTIGVGPTPLV